MEKYQKNTKVQSNYKKDKINMHAIAQKYKMKKKIRTNNSKIHNRKKYKPKLQKKTTLRGQNQQQKGHTTYIGGFAVLFFDGMSKERKIQKDKVQSVK
jgi:hypothetical protein